MKKPIGEILVEEGAIENEDLNRYLEEHKDKDIKIGEFLVLQGIVNEPQVADGIARQLNVERYKTENYPIDTSMTEILPFEVAQPYRCVPLKKKNRLLTIAVTDPNNIETIDFIENYTNYEVKVVVCTDQELNHLTLNIYGMAFGIEDIIEDMSQQYLETTTDMMDEETLEMSSLQDMVEDAPVVRLVNEILAQAIREKASDVHISPENKAIQVRFRVDGKLHSVLSPPKSMMLPIISRLKLISGMDISVFRSPQDGRFTIKLPRGEINIRTSTIPTLYGENLVMRLLDTSSGIYSLEQLGMSEKDREKSEKMLLKPYGMLLSTGPTGSGKTTTLYSMIKEINKPDINIITLEDPIEYRIESIRQIRLNPQAGMDFSKGIRAILRQDPDVIMIGEIRDAETASIAIQSALTGHRVLSTLHTNNAAGAVTRFIDMGAEPFLLSSVLLLLIAQRLVRRICPYCKEPYTPSKAQLKFWNIKEEKQDSIFLKATGCFNCMSTGYRGRAGVFEVLAVDEMLRELILKNASAHEINRIMHETGRLRTLKEDAGDKIRMGITTFEEAGSIVME